MKLFNRIIKACKEPNVFDDYEIEIKRLEGLIESKDLSIGISENKSKNILVDLETLNLELIKRHDDIEDNLRFTKVLKNKYKDLKDELKDMESNYDETCDKLRELFRLKISDIDKTIFYNKYKVFDVDGWCMYYAAKSLIAIEVTSFFYAEDNKGYFENSDGFELTNWLQIAKFGDIQWEQINSFEIMDSFNLEKKSEEFLKYKKELIRISGDNLIVQLLERDIEDLYSVISDITKAEELRMIS